MANLSLLLQAIVLVLALTISSTSAGLVSKTEQVPTAHDLYAAIMDDSLSSFTSLLTLLKETPRQLSQSLKADVLPGEQTVLLSAILMGRTEFVRVLLETPMYQDLIDFDQGEKDGYTPYHAAAFQGRHEIVHLLVAQQIPGGMTSHKDGFYPIHRACWGKEERHTLTVEAFLIYGIPIELKGKGKTCGEMTENAGTKRLIEPTTAEL
jgi:ankyrin repeat protein